jgi:DNA-binding NtrC family response regulator
MFGFAFGVTALSRRFGSRLIRGLQFVDVAIVAQAASDDAAFPCAGSAAKSRSLHLPNSAQCSLHRRISQAHPQILTIIISAFQEQHAQEHARSVGAFAFLFKPFDGEELLRTVEAACFTQQGCSAVATCARRLQTVRDG